MMNFATTNSPTDVTNIVNQISTNSHAVIAATRLVISGTTNQIIFGATNTPPADTNLLTWISVQVTGDTNIYRLGLAK